MNTNLWCQLILLQSFVSRARTPNFQLLSLPQMISMSFHDINLSSFVGAK